MSDDIKLLKLKNNSNAQNKFRTFWSANPFKIYSHIPKLYEWYMGKDVYPISIEIGITSQCNHNCCFCSVKPKHIDRNSYLSEDVLNQFVSNAKEMDVRSVVVSGSGEQTLHPFFSEFLKKLKNAGIYIGLNTNGSMLTESLCRIIIESVTWIRVSLDASSEIVRKSVHGVKDLHKATEGLRKLVALKKKTQSQLSIGTQMVVCPENGEEIESCTQLSHSLGVDYQQIKPVIPFDLYYPYRKGKKKEMKEWLRRIKTVAKNFSENELMVNVRYDQFNDYINGTNLREEAHLPCLITFSPYIEADGKVWFCVDKKGYDDYYLGDMNKVSLKTIWHSERRKEVLDYVKKNTCGHICRNSPLNEFLFEMKNPSPFYYFL